MNINGAGSSSSNDFRAQFNLNSSTTNNTNKQFINNTNSTSHLTNPNQVAFNYERRSKTPNILQRSKSQVNFLFLLIFSNN